MRRDNNKQIYELIIEPQVKNPKSDELTYRKLLKLSYNQSVWVVDRPFRSHRCWQMRKAGYKWKRKLDCSGISSLYLPLCLSYNESSWHYATALDLGSNRVLEHQCSFNGLWRPLLIYLSIFLSLSICLSTYLSISLSSIYLKKEDE